VEIVDADVVYVRILHVNQLSTHFMYLVSLFKAEVTMWCFYEGPFVNLQAILYTTWDQSELTTDAPTWCTATTHWFNMTRHTGKVIKHTLIKPCTLMFV